MTKNLILFNQDLRIKDNPALFFGCREAQEILPIFILDEVNRRALGGASKWFLHFALESLARELLKKLGLKLVQKKGDVLEILRGIFLAQKITAIYFNRSVDADGIRLEKALTKLAEENRIEVFGFDAVTIFSPQKIKNGSGNYYKVFTPFWKECLKHSDAVVGDFDRLSLTASEFSTTIMSSDDLDLLPKKNWAEKFAVIWEFNYEKIQENFSEFLENKVHDYRQARDFPNLEGTSKLSPYLHFGMISARQIFLQTKKSRSSQGSAQFLTEIGWREFCHHLLFHFPDLPQKNFRAEFDQFPWQKNDQLLQKWQRGQTGFPIVDAGMRELWNTGFMHNRVRMIVASFLVKDLLIDWREGEKWFWNCLVDADLANNVANWQWVAGSGADAAPYFRIFNPVLQSERFDAEGNYIRKWIPELAKLPNRLIHKPWEADEKLLESCGIKLGENYPQRVLDHKTARDFALLAFRSIK